MVTFGPLAAEIGPVMWGTPPNFNGFRVLAALLHGILVVGVSVRDSTRSCVDVFLRLGYCSRETPAITEADETLFGSILANSNHVLQSYLPERSLSQYNSKTKNTH